MGYCADVILIESPGESASWKNQAELACRFYGLETKILSARSRDNDPEIFRALANESTLAAITSAKALSSLNRAQVLTALRRPRGSVPLLIPGVTAATNAAFLNLWSASGVLAGRGPVDVSSAASFNIANLSNIARQLAGQSLPFPSGSVHALELKGCKPQAIIRIQDGHHDLPVFVSAHTAGQEVYFQSEYEPCKAVGQENLLALFPYIAPTLMFLRYVAGDRAWHSIGHYANLTIDDPWLTEPYGNLSYEGLLREMEQHNFHTTIAFIPWNFDRSKPAVVSLFRSHQDRYSICVHGNNHDDREFYEYQRYPLSEQILSIRQGIARMEKFKTLTGIPYDRVMIWPHEVVPPTPTLALLKENNFVGSLNLNVVPLGSESDGNPLLSLRQVCLSSADLLTIKRLYVGARSLVPRIAINAFLENPMLFYAHEDFFANGSDAFNDTAGVINRIQPDSLWKGLGELVRHLYLVKLREDANYDLMAFSSQLTIENPLEQDVTFFVRKTESFDPPIKSLTVDGESHPYYRSGNLLFFEVSVPAKRSKEIVIAYEGDKSVSDIDISKVCVRTNLIRGLADFRDMTMSRYSFSRAFVRFYNAKLFKIKLYGDMDLDTIVRSFLTRVAVFLSAWRRAE